MTADQLDLMAHLAEIEAAARAVDARTAEILATVAGDPIHSADRRRIVEAILWSARRANGAVDPNAVREALTGPHGLIVYPRLIGAMYAALRHRGILTPAGWTTSRDAAGGNAGRPARTYRLADWSARADAA